MPANLGRRAVPTSPPRYPQTPPPTLPLAAQTDQIPQFFSSLLVLACVPKGPLWVTTRRSTPAHSRSAPSPTAVERGRTSGPTGSGLTRCLSMFDVLSSSRIRAVALLAGNRPCRKIHAQVSSLSEKNLHRKLLFCEVTITVSSGRPLRSSVSQTWPKILGNRQWACSQETPKVSAIVL